MLNEVEIVVWRIETVDQPRIEKMHGAGCDGWRGETFRHIRERHQDLVLSHCDLGPERHAGRRRHPAERQTALQCVATRCPGDFLRFVIVCSWFCRHDSPRSASGRLLETRNIGNDVGDGLVVLKKLRHWCHLPAIGIALVAAAHAGLEVQ